MDFRLNLIDQISPEHARTLIPKWLCGFMDLNAERRASTMEQMASDLGSFDDESVSRCMEYLRTLGDQYALYRSDPVAQTLTRTYMRTLMADARVFGIEHLRTATASGPTLLLCNHLAYCDTQIKDVLLVDNGAADLAEKLIVVAGPKVYDDMFRRMASMGLNTLKTAQSAALTHNEKNLSPREIASIALGTVRTAHIEMRAGNMVLVYAEGARSRTRRLGPFLKAVRKYLQVENCQVVPLALTGSQQMMPLNQFSMAPFPVHLRIGEPVKVNGLDTMSVMEEVWSSIAAMLPDEQKPQTGTERVI